MEARAKKSVQEPVWSACNKCSVETRHDILCAADEHGDEHYSFWRQYAVVECRGCATRSFRYNFKDIENAYPISHDEWEVPEDIEYYPRLENKTLAIDGIEIVPEIVRSIYLETVTAIYEQSFILAGLGLRGTVEAVCNDQKVSGGSLDKMIKSLVTKGMISKKDGERLHAIRFMGNDAAHEIKRPSPDQINVAVKIIKHLIASVYTLKKEAEGNLEFVVSDFEDYMALINTNLLNKESGEELPLVAILGRDVRRLGDNRTELESQLTAAITSGEVSSLKLGKVDTFAGSKDELQHFVII